MGDIKGKVVLAGGSGFVGRNLSVYLRSKGSDVVVLTRATVPSNKIDGVKYVTWDGRHKEVWAEELEGAAAVINLAGKNVNCRFTKQNKLQIVQSRVESAAVLADAFATCNQPPGVFIQCSAVGYYGDTAVECDENSVAGNTFLAEVCRKLEGTLDAFSPEGTRKVVLRLGVVLGRDGGAYPMLASAVNSLMGGTVGNGLQYMSWIHIDDLCGILLEAIENEAMAGVYNAVAPGAVSNKDFMAALRKDLRKPWSPPVPEFIIRAVTGPMGSNSDLILHGQNVVPQRLLDNNYQFKYRGLSGALGDLSRKE
ncbi:TIGR01777 family protein [bacterium E08(2017)]|nr:TIGR01777 family protein [bacterium E08(2017)]